MAASRSYAIFAARYQPFVGGIETFTERLARQLVMNGDKAVVVTSRMDDSLERETTGDGIEVFRLPSRAFLDGRLPVPKKGEDQRRLFEELEGTGIDRVLVNARFYGLSLEGVRFAKRIGAPVIVLDHGSSHLTMGNPVLDKVVERYEHSVTERMKKMEPAFAGISEASAKWLEHFDIHTDLVIPNAIDVEEFAALSSGRDFRKELGIDEEKTLAVFVGRLEPEKGAFEFARAASMLDERFAFAMAGEGSLRKNIETLGNDDLHLLGNISQNDLSALLGQSQVFCLPSRSEGFCSALAEAASQGAIPVMPHVGIADEIMSSKKGSGYGILLETRDPEEIAQGIEAARNLVESQAEGLRALMKQRYSWEAASESLDRAFKSIEAV